MNDEHLHRDPGMLEVDGAATALVEQQRSTILAGLRSAQAASVTMLDPDGDGIHWGIYLHPDGDADAFLVYAAVRAISDAAAALEKDPAEVCGLVLAAIQEGIGT